MFSTSQFSFLMRPSTAPGAREGHPEGIRLGARTHQKRNGSDNLRARLLVGASSRPGAAGEAHRPGHDGRSAVSHLDALPMRSIGGVVQRDPFAVQIARNLGSPLLITNAHHQQALGDKLLHLVVGQFGNALPPAPCEVAEEASDDESELHELALDERNDSPRTGGGVQNESDHRANSTRQFLFDNRPQEIKRGLGKEIECAEEEKAFHGSALGLGGAASFPRR